MSTSSPRSSYAAGTVANMARSLLVVAALVAALIAIVPRVNTVSQPPVNVAAAAVEVARESGWAISRPEGLPEGWKATSVRYVRSTDGLQTWHAGYQSPTGNYVALEQTQDATQGWIEAQTNRARRTGEVQAAGQTWTTFERSPKVQRSLLSTEETADGLTTLITGTGTFDELKAFAETLRPVQPAG
ncbi:DUF4245 domain-containing protein [Knoellia sp. p5-6-4]|uniref:DUF4245 domain-containing protein n=1 Tax=unclassified Knoellia TaxID=2618719 RepID=UPI0023DB3F78|nr:DUF4245 domain-containing protein [Knoellia sp. p5-6-4]MDF2144365.1 DUF4245 domain-containing protein [Knoellia sp. p5-6-4]